MAPRNWRQYTGTHKENVANVNSGMWGTVRSAIGKATFVEDAVAMYYAAQDDATPRFAKAALFAALAYFVCPIDLVSDAIPVLGWSDDATVIASVLKLMRSYVTDAHRAKARERLSMGWVRESNDAAGDAAASGLA